MGMDCIPLNGNVEPFHANWGGWTFILRALLLAVREFVGVPAAERLKFLKLRRKRSTRHSLKFSMSKRTS